jgi:DNA repair protein RadA/Sms
VTPVRRASCVKHAELGYDGKHERHDGGERERSDKTMAAMNLTFDDVKPGTNINDIKVDPRLRVRVSTGLDFVDYVLSGEAPVQGLLPGGVYLFTGTPGAGKSTLGLQMLNGLSGQGHLALMNGREEAAAQTKMTYERLNLKSGFTIANAVFMDRPEQPRELVERIGDNYLRHHLDMAYKQLETLNAKRKEADKKHMGVLIDSLQAMNDGKWGLASNSKTHLRVAEAVIDWAKKHFVAVVMIGHVGKGGEFAGHNQLLHMVDGHLHLYIDDDEKSPHCGCRILECRKNRFGPTGISVVLDIGKTGLKEKGSRRTMGMRIDSDDD